MKISQSGVDCGVEVDCGAAYREGNKMFRVLIRKHGSRYAVHKQVFYPKSSKDRVEYSGSLRDCIYHVRRNYSIKEGLDD